MMYTKYQDQPGLDGCHLSILRTIPLLCVGTAQCGQDIPHLKRRNGLF